MLSFSDRPSDHHHGNRLPLPRHPEGALRAQGIPPELLSALPGAPLTPLDALTALPGILPGLLGLWCTRRAARYAMRYPVVAFTDARRGFRLLRCQLSIDALRWERINTEGFGVCTVPVVRGEGCGWIPRRRGDGVSELLISIVGVFRFPGGDSFKCIDI